MLIVAQHLFGAICPARGVGAALAMPYADSEAMQLHLDEVSRVVRRGAHAVLLLDRAGLARQRPARRAEESHAPLPPFPRSGACMGPFMSSAE
jgi:hypothetical protein